MIQGNIGSTKVLVIEKKATEKKSASGLLIIPGIGKDPQICGKIIQIGAGTVASPMEAKVGETVLFYPGAAQRFCIEDTEVCLIESRDLLFRFIADAEVL